MGAGAGAGDMTLVVHVVGRDQGRHITAAQGIPLYAPWRTGATDMYTGLGLEQTFAVQGT